MKQEKSVPYNLRLPAKLKSKLEKEAREKKRSLNQQIVFLLETAGTREPQAATAAN